jgi:hypothetical protein
LIPIIGHKGMQEGQTKEKTEGHLITLEISSKEELNF